jgi:hypothetical protein
MWKSRSAKNVLRLTTPEEKILQTGIVLPITTAPCIRKNCADRNNREWKNTAFRKMCRK